MPRYIITIICVTIIAGTLQAQQHADDAYKKPLQQVLAEVQARFHVTVKYADSMVAGKWLSYADWRYKTDAASTLAAMLSPFDMVAAKTDSNTYKLKYYEYYRTTVAEGKTKLDKLAAQYHDSQSWEQRKDSLRSCMFAALRLQPLPAAPKRMPIISNKRKMDGYEIENIAFEILPGVYTCGSIYRPLNSNGKIPVMLCPDGHWDGHRYRPDCQKRCAMLAKMGCMAISYDLFAWGESLLQFKPEDHRRSLAMMVQALSSLRILDYVYTLKEADTARIGISGGSGGGSQTMLVTALDDRIKISVPVVMLSCYMYGGCPCESGLPVHLCGGGTNNPEMAAMAAPRPQLVISDGGDWSDHVPGIEFPYLQQVYNYYGKKNAVQNVHLPAEGHDFGPSKRKALYDFVATQFNLNTHRWKDATGNYPEKGITIERKEALFVFGDHGEKLPAHAIKNYSALEKIMETNR